MLTAKIRADPALADSGLVLAVGGDQLDLGHAGGDEDGVQRHEGHEHAMAHDVAVAAGALARSTRDLCGLGHEGDQDAGIGDEGERVGEEEESKARGGQEAAGEPADPDPEVHHDPLHRERGRASLGRGQAGDQGRLRRPEDPVPDARDRAREEAVPRRLDEGVSAEADGEEAERDSEHPPAAEPVDERPGERPGDQADRRIRAENQPGEPEREATLVVEVDEREREHEPVPDRVRKPAELEDLHRARQLRVQAAEIAGHDETLASGGSAAQPLERAG